MALSLSSLVRAKSDKPPRIVIYGVPGIGKTSLAAEFPEPIFIQTEEGAGNLELTSFAAEPLVSFGQVDEAIELLLTGDHRFRTAVVDSLDWLEPIVWAETCRQHGWKSIEEAGYGKGYVEADVAWRYLLARLSMLRDQRGMTLVLLAHEEIRSFSDPERDSYELEFEVLDGPHKGRRFWTTLNLWNPNPVAVEIAQRELNTICHAVGKLRVADTEELHGIPLRVTLGIEKDSDRNVAKGYKPATGATSGTPGAGGAARPRGPWA